MRILVVGAGIGGLAAACALLRDGHDVTVHESAPALRTSGAALTLWSNGTGVLDGLGVPVKGLGAPLDVLEQRGWDGQRLSAIDLTRAASRYGHPHLSMPRRALIQRLAEQLPPDVVEFGHVLEAVQQDDGAVRAVFEDGSQAEADLLVGADGHHSVVRAHVWGEANRPEPTGWSTWQGLTRTGTGTAASATGLMITGPEGMCGLLPAGDGLLQWWFDVRHGGDAPVSPVAMLRERFGHWASPVSDTLDVVTDADTEMFVHHRNRVPRVWSRGRAVLLGDAAHTMPPVVAQGGNQALEDAWALAAALRAEGEQAGALPDALRAYERARARRAGLTSRVAAAGTADTYRPWTFRLAPDALMSRAYTRWLRMVSGYLATDR